jgi:putative ABC transport system permease protein
MPSLTEDDAAAILDQVPGVVQAAPYVRGSVQVIAGNLNWATSAYGTTPGYLTARGWLINSGRNFSPEEMKSSGKVAIIGKTVAESLFPGQDPLEQPVRIQRVPFRVIATLEPKGDTGRGDQDDVIFIPLSTAKKRVLGGRIWAAKRWGEL